MTLYSTRYRFAARQEPLPGSGAGLKVLHYDDDRIAPAGNDGAAAVIVSGAVTAMSPVITALSSPWCAIQLLDAQGAEYASRSRSSGASPSPRRSSRPAARPGHSLIAAEVNQS